MSVWQSPSSSTASLSLHVIELTTRSVTDLGFGRTPVWSAAVFAADVLDADPPSEPSTPTDPCAPHGELHGDHCHCDAGYVEVNLACVPAP